ncbi:OmpA family protein [Sphingomonas sp. H39-1-10]|uniref:OmpA family protein n=1 Tax=Sphingomonas pollutisoli TaxID=3030829 RepID=UPI0023B88DB1|nr:OmpA family protein [Sphingomonas pollutisoli]MDF0488344.1 OmpA family protein [Sphingomonas pollutisoli]
MSSSAAMAQSSVSGSASGSNSNSAATSNPVNTNAAVAQTQSGATSTSGSNSNSNSNSQSGADASNSGNAQSITSNSYAPERQKLVTTPSVFTPALTTTLTDTCMGSTSLGVSVLGFGASGGSTWQDKECVRRLNARELAQTLGDREAAREVICGNPDVYAVYNALGRPCRLKPNGSPNPMYVPVAAGSVAPAIAKVPDTHYTVYFARDQWKIDAGAQKILDDAAGSYQQTGTAAVQIAGHTDRSGTEEHNQKLSERRAQEVKAYLLSKGVPEQAMLVAAYGETRPAVPTPDGVHELLNRRVEITFGPGAGY